jgi:hypothetical protein
MEDVLLLSGLGTEKEPLGDSEAGVEESEKPEEADRDAGSTYPYVCIPNEAFNESFGKVLGSSYKKGKGVFRRSSEYKNGLPKPLLALRHYVQPGQYSLGRIGVNS